ncbi:Deaminated glutathione amidase [Geodia barretti]|uniref:Deaminated glutathione amidase n=1 Tax=Geodia barretti TaxID=519541 RepID=A0AA35SZY5_GEOBA|nr:Deaminated glutathione amidase [Geodia barretti]
MKFNIACIQNCATDNLSQTIQDCEVLSREAYDAGADLICLPEFFSYLNLNEKGLDVAPFRESEHPTLAAFQELSLKLQVWILLGSIAIYDSQGKKRNRSILLNPRGEIEVRYDKIHMFDVNLPNGEVYRESDVFSPGNKAVTASLPWGELGLTVCYDLRFPHLYRSLAHAGADVISVPAAFTRTTGQAHWHVMLRSRAIETGAYVVAPCQYGDHGRAKTYGHSLIIDPWGRILADGGEDRGYIIAEVDMEEVKNARRMIPALEHDRDYTKPNLELPQTLRKVS